MWPSRSDSLNEGIHRSHISLRLNGSHIKRPTAIVFQEQKPLGDYYFTVQTKLYSSIVQLRGVGGMLKLCQGFCRSDFFGCCGVRDWLLKTTDYSEPLFCLVKDIPAHIDSENIDIGGCEVARADLVFEKKI